MTTVDYTDAPIWLQIVIAVGVVVGFLIAVVRGIPPVWRFVSQSVKTINSLTDLPQFMVTTAATLHDQDVKIAEIHHEVQFNNGSSVKDAVTRVEDGVKGIYDRLDAADVDRQELREDLEQTRPHDARPRANKPKENK
jgi:hypothetical protein